MANSSKKDIKKSGQQEIDEHWMCVALEEAKKAMHASEHPIGSVLVGGTKEITRGQTSVARIGSITAHGEYLALRAAGWSVFSAERPLVLYTTLEPCLMCIGAAMQCGVDEIVFAMPAIPDGGTKYLPDIGKKGEKVPTIRSGILRKEAIKLMKENLKINPNHPGIDYAKALLRGINEL